MSIKKLTIYGLWVLPALLFGQAGTGLKGDYFPNTTLTGPVALSRVDTTVNFEWGENAPANGVPADAFSVRWSGQIEAPVSGPITFATRSDDGVRLWVDGKQIIGRWMNHSDTRDQSPPITLVAGQKYNIQLEYYDNSGKSVIKLLWSYPGQGEQVVPQSRLSPTAIVPLTAPLITTRAWLSDQTLTASVNGYGPMERDRSNGEQGASDGRTLKIGDHSYARGIGVHARSELKLAIDPKWEVFKTVVGLDEEVSASGSVIFEVWLDGVMKFQSPMMRGTDPGLALIVPLAGAKELKLIVTDGGDGMSYDHADWADARFEGGEGNVYLSDLTWTSAVNGRGEPQKDRPVAASTGARVPAFFSLRSQTYNKGLGTFPTAEVKYNLDKKYERFLAVIGIDDTALGRGSAIFEVWSGGVMIYKSDILRGGMPGQPISLDVKGKSDLVLKLTDSGDGTSMDVADWADARLTPVTTTTAPPTDPTTTPGTPANLTATPGNAQVTLSWQKVSGATSYNVYRGTATNGQSSTPVATNVTATSYVNSGLTNGTTYFYKVKAVNSAGSGNASNEASATPSAGTPTPTPPGAPSSLSATAGNATVNLTWQAVSGATTYNVYRGTAANGQSTTPVATNLTGTTYSNTGLTNGTTYFYKVRAVNTAGAGNPSNEASATPIAPPPPVTVPVAPTGLTATGGNQQVVLTWTPVTGATTYNIYRGTATNGQSGTPVATNVTAATYTNTGLTNGTTYFYKVRAVNSAGTGPVSNEASARPAAEAPTTAPAGLTATAGNQRIVLSWQAVTGATSYTIYRGTASNGQGTTPIATNVTALTYTNTGLTNGTTYFYKVAAVNTGGTGPMSTEASTAPQTAPGRPLISATGGDGRVTFTWAAVPTATSYRLYRGTAANTYGTGPAVSDIVGTSYVDTGVTNGTGYFYRLAAVNSSGEGQRSEEVFATPSGPAPAPDPATLSAFRLVRQTSWGPRPGDVDRVKSIGRAAYLQEQFNQAPSVYPDSLYGNSVEDVQEYFMRLALSGNDQLRQRVAFALSKIWAVNAADVNRPDATITYYRIFMNRAFGNYRDLMTDMTLNPAMGRFLNMLNSKSEAVTNGPANENYPRELMQLFTMTPHRLNNDGSEQTAESYTEDDVKALARLFTGWTFGDGNATSVPTNTASDNWRVPMEAVERFHDVTAKQFLGVNFGPGRTAKQDLDLALDTIFQHPNVPPFVARSLITQLVTSNPSPGYISTVANAFINNGNGVRGDLQAVLLAIFNHPEANLGANPRGKLMEPVLFVISPLRTLNATVSDYPFMSDLAAEMGQKVLYPPSVFSYFSPNFKILNGALLGPEYQTLTSVTALGRANYIARILNADLNGSTNVDYGAFTSRADNAAALVDYVALVFQGGLISTEQRTAIISAVNNSLVSNQLERARTAIYLVLTAAQYQVER